MPNLQEVLIIGSYQHSELRAFLDEVQVKYNSINIRYLQEFVELGTAGGIYHFRDQIRAGNPEFFFLLNGDVCADFPLRQLYDFHVSKKGALVKEGGGHCDAIELQFHNLILDFCSFD